MNGYNADEFYNKFLKLQNYSREKMIYMFKESLLFGEDFLPKKVIVEMIKTLRLNAGKLKI